MPFYTFECKKCKNMYEEMTSYDKEGKYPSVKCPECGSKSKKKHIGAVSFQFAQPEGTKRWNSGSGGHDYRYKHNIPKINAERKNAEKNSHVGPNPYGNAYNID